MKYQIVTDLDKHPEDAGQWQILKTPCLPFDFQNPMHDPRELASNLIETMYFYNGLGLAANQCLFLTQLFTMRGTEEKGDFACFNPKIVWKSDEIIRLDESCLSFPGVVLPIKRPRHIRLRFQVPDGHTVTEKFTGMTARIVQHEMDHLAGKLWYLRGNKYHIDRAFKNRGKFNASKDNNFLSINPFEV